MYSEFSVLLTRDNFLLSIIIIASVTLSVVTCVIIWCRNLRREIKYAFTYLIVIVLIYQISTLLAFYSPQGQFLLLVCMKTSAAFLLKTASMLYFAVYIGNGKVIKVFAFLQLLSVIFIYYLFFDDAFRNSIISVSMPHQARYEGGAQLYSIVSSILFIAAGIIFFVSDKLFRQKRRYLIFLLLFIAVNIVILAFSVFASKDLLHEKMHIYILLAFVAFLFKSTPFYEKRDRLLSAVNIIEGINEGVLIFDEKGKISYIHNGLAGIDLSANIKDIILLTGIQGKMEEGLEKNEGILKECDSEGEISLACGKVIRLYYKVAPLFFKGIRKGSIIVLRDITTYRDFIMALNKKNNQLKEAFEKQKEHLRISRKLMRENERARIFEMVNNIAGEYLVGFKVQVRQIEAVSKTKGHYRDEIKKKSEEMLEATRKVISDIRKTVKELHI